MLLSTLQLMVHQMGMDKRQAPRQTCCNETKQNPGKECLEAQPETKRFTGLCEASFHWSHVVCLIHHGKLLNPKNRFWGNLALSRTFPLLINPSWLSPLLFHFLPPLPGFLSLSSLPQSLKIQFKCHLLWEDFLDTAPSLFHLKLS